MRFSNWLQFFEQGPIDRAKGQMTAGRRTKGREAERIDRRKDQLRGQISTSVQRREKIDKKVADLRKRKQRLHALED